MFEYCLCSRPQGRDPSPQHCPPSSFPVVSSLSVESRCSAVYSEPAAALPQWWLRTRCRTCPTRPCRCIPPGARTSAPPGHIQHRRQLRRPTSPASLPVSPVPEPPPVIGASSGCPLSASRPDRVSLYTRTGALRVLSVASPFTTYTKDMPVSHAARPVNLRKAGAKDRRPFLPQGAAHCAGVRCPLSIRH